MSSSVSHQIKNRKIARDVFITPRVLAKNHIDFIDSTDNDEWLDPCRNNENGSYYSQMPEGRRDWCEILEGVSFFDHDTHLGHPDIICCNPPYSIIDKWIAQCVKIQPRIISLLIGVGNLTAKRIEIMEKGGYGLNKLKMFKVYSWYGMSYFATFTKGEESIISIDRTIYREG